ncbi:MAG: response regulator [Rickettsiales bacterium]|nr:response regulator [Rickettsiales bacterium]
MAQVLYVEDNPLDKRLFSKIVNSCDNMQMSTVSSLAAAQKYIDTTEIDVLCLDLGLQESEGIQTVKNFRELCPDIPIVIRSTEQNMEVVKNIFHIGIEGYLPKNITSKKLIHHVLHTSILKHRHASPHLMTLPIMEALYHDVVGTLASIEGFSQTPETAVNTIEAELLNYSLMELQSVMHNILDYYHTLNGQLRTTRDPVHIEQWLQSILAIVEPVAAQKNISFIRPISYPKEPLVLDKKKLENALFQLLHFLILQHHQAEFSLNCQLVETEDKPLLWLQIFTPLFEINSHLLSKPLYRNGFGPGIIVPSLKEVGIDIEVENIGEQSCINIIITT